MEERIKQNVFSNCSVEIINTIVKHEYDVDLLICDECHLLPSDQFRKIFSCVNYKLIQCLTGTLERLDGKEIIIKQYAPVCDTITADEAIENK
jgi:superfamily II DNA or RNA helicase